MSAQVVEIFSSMMAILVKALIRKDLSSLEDIQKLAVEISGLPGGQ